MGIVQDIPSSVDDCRDEWLDLKALSAWLGRPLARRVLRSANHRDRRGRRVIEQVRAGEVLELLKLEGQRQ